MASGMIHRLIDVLRSAVDTLGQGSTNSDIETIAVMVHRIMSYQSRQFHTLEHVFGFLDDTSDSQTALAAIFHDLIYYQVDDGIQPVVKDLVNASVEPDGAGMKLRIDIPESDTLFHLCRRIFGFENGRTLLPFTGLNEFLSALLFLRIMQGHLNRTHMIAVTVCIEASIPFRGPNADGRSMGDELAWRLEQLQDEGTIEIDSAEIDAMVARAIVFANKDVRDFALADSGRFLNNTWKLLPELNSSLRLVGTFSIREYRIALGKMLGFFRSLKPEYLFHSYKGTPDNATMLNLAEGVRHNLAVAVSYMQAKVLAISLLEAISQISGGDGPVALFMGDLPGYGEKADTLDHFLPDIQAPSWMDTEAPLYRLLKTGRMDESTFDLKNSPLAMFLYSCLTQESWQRMHQVTERFLSGEIDASAYLLVWPPKLRTVVIRACEKMVHTRKEVLAAWVTANP